MNSYNNHHCSASVDVKDTKLDSILLLLACANVVLGCGGAQAKAYIGWPGRGICLISLAGVRRSHG